MIFQQVEVRSLEEEVDFLGGIHIKMPYTPAVTLVITMPDSSLMLSHLITCDFTK